jgi:hypothetical protein
MLAPTRNEWHLMLAVGHLGSLDECIKRARAERAALLDSVRVVSKILKAIGEIWIRGEPVCVKVRSRVRRARGRAASPIEPTPPPQHTRHLRSLAARSRLPFCGPHVARRQRTLNADLLHPLSQAIARAHRGVQEHPAYRRGQLVPLVRFPCGSGMRV